MSSSNFLVPAMKRLMKPTQKLKPGLLPKNIIPKNKWTVSQHPGAALLQASAVSAWRSLRPTNSGRYACATPY